MNPFTSARKVTQVAVGVLLRDDGAVLLADRPAGKPYAGYWEFPGGKVEAGEPVAAALERELHEELGVDIGPSTPWVTFEHDYPHAYVRLHFRRVRHWRGAPHGREGQRFRFAHPAAGDLPQPLLPAAVPALRWLCLPEVALVAADPCRVPAEHDGRRRIIVVDADWRTLDHARMVQRWRRSISSPSDWLFATGPGAPAVVGVDGAVLRSADIAAPTARPGSAWRGGWSDCGRGSPALRHGEVDFVLMREDGPTDAAGELDAAVPTFLRAVCAGDAARPAPAPGHGVWIDLRSSR